MTASSVELFPCRVQLMGLPRSTTIASTTASGSANLGNLSVGISERPSIQKVQRVSRNLFGAPDPIEMKNLYQQEAERQRKYVLGRYNFDTKSSTDASGDYKNDNNITNEHENINSISSSFKQPKPFPTLIEQELKQYDQRPQRKKQNLCRTSLEETPSNIKNCNHTNHISELNRGNEYITTLSPAVDQQKPYTRQPLLTERFNIRKSKVCLSRNTKCCSVGLISTNNIEETRNTEIPQLLESNACEVKHKQDTKSTCKKTCVKSDKNNKSASVCKDKHTAVSLQFLLSTHNVS